MQVTGPSKIHNNEKKSYIWRCILLTGYFKVNPGDEGAGSSQLQVGLQLNWSQLLHLLKQQKQIVRPTTEIFNNDQDFDHPRIFHCHSGLKFEKSAIQGAMLLVSKAKFNIFWIGLLR